MATNKNQHYVPQCYLRQFAVENSKVTINLFNLDRKKFIKSASIKHQCSKNYFYGEDLALENALQSIENPYSPLIKSILENGYNLKDEHRFLLQKFWLLQYLRTDAASRRSVEMTEKMGEVIGEEAREFRVELADAVQNAMHVFASDMDIIDDLRVCLVRNKTDIDFVTSDDPAILTNKLFLIKKRGESFGLGTAGNLILLPLTPKVLLLGYDEHIYSVSQKNGWLNINKKTDIEALNEHQYLNCRANIYIHNSNCSKYIQDYYESVKQKRPEARHKIHYAILDQNNGNYKRYAVVDKNEAEDHEEALIHCQTINAKPSKWPMQVRWRINSFAYSNGTGVGFIRQKKANTMPNEGFRKIKVRK